MTIKHKTWLQNIFNYVGLQVGWLACVMGAANGSAWLGPLVVAFYLAIHLWLSTNWRDELKLVTIVGIIGMGIDSLNKLSGLFSYASDTPGFVWLAPVWITAMWVLFATTLNNSLAWLQNRYGVAAILGIIFGPFSYIAGARLGGVLLNYGVTVTIIVLAIIWGVVMPGLAWLAKTINQNST